LTSFFQTGREGGLSSGEALASLGLRLLEVKAYCLGFDAEACLDEGGALNNPRAAVKSVVADSRLADSGSVFAALLGENQDGHKFVPAALSQGALAAVVEKGYKLPDDLRHLENRLIRVSGTLRALGLLARAVRDRTGVTVVAVTGSVGKTTVKELLRCVFSRCLDADEFIVSQGNFNNRLGLPLTLLSIGQRTRLAVVELGASDFGEIADLCEIARPDVGLVTAAGEAHLEFFGTLEGVAKAKGELYRGLEPSAVAVVNFEDKNLLAQSRQFSGPRILFGFDHEFKPEGLDSPDCEAGGFKVTDFEPNSPQADKYKYNSLRLYNHIIPAGTQQGETSSASAQSTPFGQGNGRASVSAGSEALTGDIREYPTVTVAAARARYLDGQIIYLKGPGLGPEGLRIHLRLPGLHNALNAAAAAVTALAAGANWKAVSEGLSQAESFPGRMKLVKSPDGLYILDDCYNANPTSMAAALSYLADTPSGTVRGAILGDMLELGPAAQDRHRYIGRLAAGADLKYLALVGRMGGFARQGAAAGGMADENIALFSDASEAAAWVRRRAPKNSLTLVKGSRSVGLEKAVTVLRQSGQ
jgi:UDP-N-acetylmuramoyl-tripeptide--D-alanyl-D-alanine ligase